MSISKKKIFIFTLTFQCFIIALLIYMMYAKYTSPTVFVAPLDKKTIHISPTDTLEYFFEPKPNVVITEKYYEQVNLSIAPHYTINNDTLNERYDYPVEKSKDTYRIITLGDSFTYGMYMDTKNNWSEKLEDTVRNCTNKKFEVINLAVPNYDIQYSVERFKKRGVKYNPDLIIWFLKSDDFEQINEITFPIKIAYYQEMKETGDLEKSIQTGEFWPHTKKAIREFEEKYTEKEILKKQSEILQTINNYHSGNILIVSPGSTKRDIKFIIESFAKKNPHAYTYVDLPVFPILPDHHPSEKGHKEIAEHMYTYLLKQNLLSCTL